MKITITGRKVELQDSFQKRAEKKLSKFDRYFYDDAQAQVTVTREKNRETVEITVRSQKMIFRSERTAENMFDSLEGCVDAIARQIAKNKSKLEAKYRSDVMLEPDDLALEKEETEYELIRVKQFELRPMDVDEAILQMNMLGHQFFLFLNVDTMKMNVVYQRQNGGYGLIDPQIK